MIYYLEVEDSENKPKKVTTQNFSNMEETTGWDLNSKPRLLNKMISNSKFIDINPYT